MIPHFDLDVMKKSVSGKIRKQMMQSPRPRPVPFFSNTPSKSQNTGPLNLLWVQKQVPEGLKLNYDDHKKLVNILPYPALKSIYNALDSSGYSYVWERMEDLMEQEDDESPTLFIKNDYSQIVLDTITLDQLMCDYDSEGLGAVDTSEWVDNKWEITKRLVLLAKNTKDYDEQIVLHALNEGEEGTNLLNSLSPLTKQRGMKQYLNAISERGSKYRWYNIEADKDSYLTSSSMMYSPVQHLGQSSYLEITLPGTMRSNQAVQALINAGIFQELK